MKLYGRIMMFLTGALPMLAGTFLLTSCGSEEQSTQIPQSAEVIGVYHGRYATRVVNNETLESFSMYCYDEWNEYTDELLADNILYTLSGGVWSGNKVYYMSDWDAMYGYGVSPNIEVTTEPVFKQQEQAFTYENPNDKGTLLKVASKHYFTKEGTGNRLMLTFNDALYTLRFQAFSGFEGVDVEVKSVAVHNVPHKARFKFSSTIESWGDWTVTNDNRYVNCSQTLATAAAVTSVDFADIQNEPFVLFPIQPDEWDYWGGESFADAKARNCCYVEVKMRVKEVKDGKTYYRWGYADDDAQGREPYESAFYPYEQFNCTADWRMTYNGYYYLFLDDNGVDVNGNKITPHPEEGGSTQFSVSSQIEFRTKVNELTGGTADQWSHDEHQGNVSVTM